MQALATIQNTAGLQLTDDDKLRMSYSVKNSTFVR